MLVSREYIQNNTMKGLLNKGDVISAEVLKNLGDFSDEIFAGWLALKKGKGVGWPRPSSSRDGPFQALSCWEKNFWTTLDVQGMSRT